MFRQSLIATAGRFGIWRLTRRLTRNSPRIFMFHRFQDGPGGAGGTGVCGDDLHTFLARVGEECDFVTLAGLAQRLRGQVSGGRPLAVITVDDGYADFHSVAAPILRGLGVPASLYVTAGFVDRRCWLWWDALRYLIDAHPPGELQLQIEGKPVGLQLDTAETRHAAWNHVVDRLVVQNAAREDVVGQLVRSSGVSLPAEPTPGFAALTWEQVGELAAAGVEIGCHTQTHAFLPGLDPQALQQEVAGSKALLEQRLGIPIQTFAYPNGMPYDHTAAVETAVKEAGFSAAVVAFPTVFRTSQMYALGRWSIHPGSPMLEHVLSGASELKLRMSQS